MPRGLGDNPLKRERKARRGIQQTVHLETPPVIEQTPPPADSVGIDSLEEQSEPSSRSYNDVFFQRRPDDLPVAGTVSPNLESSPSFVEVVSPTQETALEAAAEVIPPPVPESLQAQPEPVLQADVSPAPVAVSPQAAVVTEAVAEVPATPRPEQPQEHKSGFFGRFLSKLRKS